MYSKKIVYSDHDLLGEQNDLNYLYYSTRYNMRIFLTMALYMECRIDKQLALFLYIIWIPLPLPYRIVKIFKAKKCCSLNLELLKIRKWPNLLISDNSLSLSYPTYFHLHYLLRILILLCPKKNIELLYS